MTRSFDTHLTPILAGALATLLTSARTDGRTGMPTALRTDRRNAGVVVALAPRCVR